MHHHNGGIIHGLVANLRIYVDPYRASCQVDIIGRDADGYFELVFDINRLHETAEKALYLYYETTLRTKLVSDPQSSAMMDMIIENLRTDAGYINVYSFNGFHHGFREIMSSKKNTVSSNYKGRMKATSKVINKLNTSLAKLAETNP